MEDNDITRREFVSLTVGAGIAAASGIEATAQQRIVETNVDIKTPDGTCDAAFIHPATGAHPANVLRGRFLTPEALLALYAGVATADRLPGWLRAFARTQFLDGVYTRELVRSIGSDES